MSVDDLEELPSYIVNTRKQNFEKILKFAISNELNETEQTYINEKYFLQLNISEIAKKHSVSRQSIYRVLQSASNKLFNSLKYVYCCGFTLLDPPKDFEDIFSNISRRNIS